MTPDSAAEAPFPRNVATVEELTARLRSLRTWSGLSYREVHRRVVAARTVRGVAERPVLHTVYNCFQPGRVRLDIDLVVDIARVLLGSDARAEPWRQACCIVIERAEAAGIVHAQAGLPEDDGEFVGRRRELGTIAQLCAPRAADGPVSLAIEGMAGIGKTRLAIHAGHQLQRRQRFVRVLFVNLRGFHPDPGQPPADPAAVLNSFLRLLDVPGSDIPNDLAGRMRLYQEHLAHRRVLIVLDNAADADQVEPLLPANPGCLTLITSRRRLTGLACSAHLRLGVFSVTEALDYLRAMVGERYESDPTSAAGIADALGCLPLALALTVGRITSETDSRWTLADHLQRIRERRERLRLDDAVEASLSLSYDDLLAEHQRMLRLLALHPGADLGIHAAAALAATDLAAAQGRLDQLVANHLVHHKVPGRYELHDLVRAHASARGYDSDRNPDRRAALARLTQHYQFAASCAMDAIYPYERYLRPSLEPATTATPDLSSETAAREWLEAERGNLLAVAMTGDAAAFSAILWRHLVTVADYAYARTLHQHAADLANIRDDDAGQAAALKNLGFVFVRIGQRERAAVAFDRALRLFVGLRDRDGQARTLNNVGVMYVRSGQHEQAADAFGRALRLFVELGDRDGQARTLNSLGIMCGQTGSYRESSEHFARALALFRELGDRDGQAMALQNLGEVCVDTGRHDEAIDYTTQALTLGRELGDRDGQACALAGLGKAYFQTDRHSEAVIHHEQALALFVELGDPRGQAAVLTYLGEVHHRLGQPDLASGYYRRSLALSVDLGDLRGQAMALNRLGEAALATGDLHDAEVAHAEALRHAAAVGDRHEQARAHAGLGHAHRSNAPRLAGEHWRKALAFYDELGINEVGELRAQLATLDG